MLLQIVIPFLLIIPGLALIQIFKLKLQSHIDKIICSYVVSLSVIFSILYVGAIFFWFNVASILVLVIVIIASLYLLWRAFLLSKSNFQTIRNIINNISNEEWVLGTLIFFLIAVYSLTLSSRALLDSDVVQYYLPIARDILIQNGFTNNTGYDYNFFLRPIAGSVLYSLTYFLSGSLVLETFRLLPLIPLLLLILLIYKITILVTNSKQIGILSAIIFLLLPFHGRLLVYNAFYPDVFYYPLIFAALYFLLRFVYESEWLWLTWIGIALGIASLLKAQTIYVAIVIVVLVLISELKRTKIALVTSFLLPFLIIFPNLLLQLLQNNVTAPEIQLLNSFQMLFFIFLACLASVGYIFSSRRGFPREKIETIQFTELAKKLFYLIFPIMLFSGLWYFNNFIKFGTLIFTSSINIPNFDWALEILESLSPTPPTVNPWHYFLYFGFMFIHPAVFGYVALVLVLLGLFFINEMKFRLYFVLFLFGLFYGIIVFSNVIWNLQYALVSTINPRDLLILAPILVTTAASGIYSLLKRINQNTDIIQQFYVSLFILTFFGLLLFVHSVEVWNLQRYGNSLISSFSLLLASLAGFTINQTTMQLYPLDQIALPTDYFFNIIVIVIFGCLLVLVILLARGIAKRSLTYYSRFSKKSSNIWRMFPRLFKRKQIKIPKQSLVIFLLASVIIVPRIEMLLVQGGVQGISQNQQQRTYGPLFEFITFDYHYLDGDIITYQAPYGMPYYLVGYNFIDLKITANLAFLKDDLMTNSSAETVDNLVSRGIWHILINPSTFDAIDSALNYTFSAIINNSTLSELSHTYDIWDLYTLTPLNNPLL